MTAITTTVFTHKGGVGKTTTTLNMASALASQGYRVLAIDTDEKPDLGSTFLGRPYIQSLNKINTVAALFDPHLSAQVEPQHLIQATRVENIWLVASSPLFTFHEQHDPLTQLVLREFIEEISDAFDFIFIDTPPRLSSQGTWASLLAVDAVITPVQMSKYSVEAMSDTNKLIAAAKSGGNAALRFLGYIINKREARGKIYDLYETQMRERLGEDVFTNVVPDLIAFEEAQSEEKTIFQYSPKSKAAKLTNHLADEFVHRLAAHGLQPTPTRRAA